MGRGRSEFGVGIGGSQPLAEPVEVVGSTRGSVRRPRVRASCVGQGVGARRLQLAQAGSSVGRGRVTFQWKGQEAP